MQFQKCCYCEERVPDTHSNQQIEHFWPKVKYTNIQSRWENLLLACAECNGAKGCEFPLDDDGNPLIIDPSSNTRNPEDHITFIAWPPDPADMVLVGRAEPRNNSIYGSKTIDAVKLYSRSHREARFARFMELFRWYSNFMRANDRSDEPELQNLRSEIEGMMSERSLNAGFVREFARQARLDGQGINIPS